MSRHHDITELASAAWFQFKSKRKRREEERAALGFDPRKEYRSSMHYASYAEWLAQLERDRKAWKDLYGPLGKISYRVESGYGDEFDAIYHLKYLAGKSTSTIADSDTNLGKVLREDPPSDLNALKKKVLAFTGGVLKVKKFENESNELRESRLTLTPSSDDVHKRHVKLLKEMKEAEDY